MKRTLKVKLHENEYWWGGSIDEGVRMPFGVAEYKRNLENDPSGNQANPLLISNKGRYLWSEQAFDFSFYCGELIASSERDEIVFGEGFGNLREVYRHVCEKYFPASGRYPDPLLFTAPQYNLWIELLYKPTQEKVIEYAEAVLHNGMAPGVLMVDDNWQEHYGSWDFHPGRFPDPKAMTYRLHQMGFKVMVWIIPFVSPDTMTFRELRKKGFLIKDQEGEIAIRKWWNGHSAVLDSTNPEAVAWLQGEMDRLMREYGIDGFKLDAGDVTFYRETDQCAFPTTPEGHCEAWAKVGLKYSLNEYRACWKMAGQPLVQRLRDKAHSWDRDGLASLIPNGLAQGLAGYAFNCPDMIGGGEFESFLSNSANLDQELFVRYAQCSALFPMMQFSAAPWRVLDKEHLSYCVEAAKLHHSLGNEIEALARQAADMGEPIMRHMAFVFPEGGYETVTDQFMLGNNILVAPVLQKGARERRITFPEGVWVGDDGSIVEGPCVKEIKTPLSRLPWYRKKL